MMCSLVSNISVAYSVYFDSRIIGIASTFFQASVMIFFVYWFYRWVKLIAAKQNTTYIRFDQLSADESATLSYIIPLFIAPTMQLLYLFSSGMQTWQNLSEVGPIFHIAVIYTLHMALVRKFYFRLCMYYSIYTFYFNVLMLYSGTWPHSSNASRYENESPSIEANIRSLYVPRD